MKKTWFFEQQLTIGSLDVDALANLHVHGGCCVWRRHCWFFVFAGLLNDEWRLGGSICGGVVSRRSKAAAMNCVVCCVACSGSLAGRGVTPNRSWALRRRVVQMQIQTHKLLTHSLTHITTQHTHTIVLSLSDTHSTADTIQSFDDKKIDFVCYIGLALASRI